ncbi:MAG: sulfotransferase [Phycisphaerales bacterium]|nr:MAG: sulfotransferase [Phycisphaerales bacterium]
MMEPAVGGKYDPAAGRRTKQRRCPGEFGSGGDGEVIAVDMARMIFVTGFARGGTSWLRDCIAFHPDVGKIPGEMVLFRDHSADREGIARQIEQAIIKKEVSGPYYVNKAPANAPHVGHACRLFPESKFIFIIRDPRDVFISHKRGKQKWMGGENSRVAGCMKKTRLYYEGYLQARDEPNILLVTYEQLHQDFHATIKVVFEFIGLRIDKTLVDACYEKNNFWNLASRNVEDRDKGRRKGVVGDWVNFLTHREEAWYHKQRYWRDFMAQFGYDWRKVTYESILKAMKEGGVIPMTEDMILEGQLHPDRPSLILLHDIDLLTTPESRQGVLDIARIEGELGMASMFDFLPLDDARYQPLQPRDIVEIIHQIRELSPRSGIGLHLNATERFFPIDAPEADESHELIPEAIACLHHQIEQYREHGIEFRLATAHGYGRRDLEPNNASAVFRTELGRRGIRMFDKDVRRGINKRVTHKARLDDVGGALSVRLFPHAGRVDDAESYRRFPGGSVIHFLIHPGNYPIHKPLTLGLRMNRLPRTAVRAGA